MITDLIIIILIVIIILLFRIYKYNYRNIFSVTLDSYFDRNYNIEVKMFIFKLVSKFTYFNWKSKDNYYNLFNTALYYFNIKNRISVDELYSLIKWDEDAFIPSNDIMILYKIIK